ncbi:RNA polymerase sigma factor [Actinomadura kijaniata]|uniref:RNA polymerase sigma factor n=1 Tax=Actinomadura kijaniata TaxID=46161 RepID=UPI00083293EF|nr:RNA polymerase sigma factor [Actinomadura kijaniata]
MADDREERFSALFRRHHTRVTAYVLRRTDDAGRADDVVAETFAAAWRHIDRLPEEPLPWLFRTAGNCLANDRRSRRRQARMIGSLAGLGATSVADHAVDVAESARLRDALAALPPRDREALLLVAWEGLDQRSAAEALGCSVTAFKVRLHRARRRFAALLESTPSVETRTEAHR